MSEYDFREVGNDVALLGMQLFYNLRTLVDDNYKIPDQRKFSPAVLKAIKSGELEDKITKKIFFASENEQSEDVYDMFSVAMHAGLIDYCMGCCGDYFRFNISQAGARRALRGEHQYKNEEMNKFARLILKELSPELP